MATIQVRRGLFSALPAEAAQGEPLYSTDTNQFFIGNGTGNPLTEIGAASSPPPPPPPYTDEEAQDAVGTILTDSATVALSYIDATPSINATIVAGSIGTTQLTNNGVTLAKIAQIAGKTVLGKGTSTTGNVEAIGPAGTGHVLRESSGAISFGQVNTAHIADAAVTDDKFRGFSALSILGRSVNSLGVGADIVATAGSGGVLRESGSVIGFGTIATAGIADNAVTLAKLASAVADALVPVGTILPYGGSTTPPSGYLLCNGAAVARTGTYAALFTAIGTNFGVGDNSTTFNLPDLIGRMPIGAGAGSGLTSRTRGAKYGAETVVMTAANMPSGVMYIATGTGTNAVQSGVSFSNYVASAFVAGSATGMAILNPSQAVNFIIKY